MAAGVSASPQRHRVSACRALPDSADAEMFPYPGDQHLFADSSLPSYAPDAAPLLTQRVIEFLDARR